MTFPFFFSILLLTVVYAFPDIQRRATGDRACGNTVCVSATVDGSTTSYVLSSLGDINVGWMAIGFGSRMANTPMVIMWMNSDGNATLSQRSASTEVMPTVVSSPPRIASFSRTLSDLSSSSKPSLAFTIPSNSDTRQTLIYALGTTRPGSSSVSATLIQHYDYGVIQLDLTKNATPTASSSPTPTGAVGSISLLPYQKIIVAHAIFCTIGFLLVLPAGALLARYLRTFRPVWFKGHVALQFFIAGPIIFIGVMLGIAAVSKARAMHLDSLHKRWGIVIFVLYVVQIMLGAFIHYAKRSVRRPPQNYLHAIVGLLVISLALYQVRTGYNVEWPTTTGRDPLPAGVDVLYWVWVVLLPVSYGVGLVFLPKQYQQERKSAQRRLNESNGFRMQPSSQ